MQFAVVKILSLSRVGPYNLEIRKSLEAKHHLSPLPPKRGILVVGPSLLIEKDKVLSIKSFAKGFMWSQWYLSSTFVGFHKW